MGNQSSKPSKGGSGGRHGSHHHGGTGDGSPEFRRSDTQTSTRSGRSVRSNRSARSYRNGILDGPAAERTPSNPHARANTLDVPAAAAGSGSAPFSGRRRSSTNSMASTQTMHSARATPSGTPNNAETANSGANSGANSANSTANSNHANSSQSGTATAGSTEPSSNQPYTYSSHASDDGILTHGAGASGASEPPSGELGTIGAAPGVGAANSTLNNANEPSNTAAASQTGGNSASSAPHAANSASSPANPHAQHKSAHAAADPAHSTDSHAHSGHADDENGENSQHELPFVASTRMGENQPLILYGQGSQADINIDDTIQSSLDVGYSGKTPRNFCSKSSEIASICREAQDILLSQPSSLELSPPVKVVGDVHGQYSDSSRSFGMCGFPPQSNYLFLGDYVDRGKQSLETIMSSSCYKIKYPENFFISRGNHESASVTRIYGFYDECKRRSSMKTWRTSIDTFNTLPIAAIVAQKIFCVHGGLSPSLANIDDIRAIERPTDVPEYGLLNDLLWSDPTDGPNEWEDNERGVSYCYNKVAINKFSQRFGFDLVCRAHMVVEDGYEFFNERSLVTVFSAPNYCGEFDNWGAAMSVSEELSCSFESSKPSDSAASKEEMRRERHERRGSRS